MELIHFSSSNGIIIGVGIALQKKIKYDKYIRKVVEILQYFKYYFLFYIFLVCIDNYCQDALIKSDTF